MDCRIVFHGSNPTLVELRRKDVFLFKKCNSNHSLVPIELSLIQDEESREGPQISQPTLHEEPVTEAVPTAKC